jgi:hypothetical protein
MSDLTNDLAKNKNTQEQLNTQMKTIDAKIGQMKLEKKQTEDDMAAQLKLRNSEHADFVKDLKDVSM